MIFKSKHHPILYSFFKHIFASLSTGMYFNKVIFSGTFSDRGKPVFVVANHLSWWDGIWIMYFNIKKLNRKFHFMMLENMMLKNKLANQVGGFSVKKGSRSIVETLNYTAELLNSNENMVLVFPQGKIESLYTPYIHFENGYNNILKKVPADAQIVFLVNLVDYLSNIKPTLSMYFKEYENVNLDANKMEDNYNHFYSQCVAEQMLKTENE